MQLYIPELARHVQVAAAGGKVGASKIEPESARESNPAGATARTHARTRKELQAQP